MKLLSDAFADNAIYLAGVYSPNKMSAQVCSHRFRGCCMEMRERGGQAASLVLLQKLTMLHPHKELLDEDPGTLSPCKEVVPGIYIHGQSRRHQTIDIPTV